MNNEFVKEMTDTDLNKLLEAVSAEIQGRKTTRQETAWKNFLMAFQDCVDVGMTIKYSDEDDEYYVPLHIDGFYYE